MIRADNPETRVLAASIISQGGLIAFRTDTFYGIGADPFNQEAVERIKMLKGREDGKPILLLIADSNTVSHLMADRSDLFELVRKQLWPGPLTIVVPAVSHLSGAITAGTGTVGLRLPNDENVKQLVRECGGVLTATSANPAGQEPAQSAAQVSSYFPVGVDLVVDGGEVTVTEPSTVLDITRTPPKLIREGVLSRGEIENAIGKID